MTIFSNNVPLELTLRIWDVFFIEGQKIMYRVALAVLKINEKHLMNGDCEKVLNILKSYLNSNIQFPSNKPENERENSIVIDKINQNIMTDELEKSNMEEKINKIIEVANSFSFKKKLLEDLAHEFETKPKEEI
jgi:hypothetical protein